MNITLTKGKWETHSGDVLTIIVPKNKNWAVTKDSELNKAVRDFQTGVKDKKIKKEMWLSLKESSNFKYLLLLSPDLLKYYTESEKVKIHAKQLLDYLEQYSLEKVLVLLNTKPGSGLVADFAEGLRLAHYKFDKYLKKDETTPKSPEPLVTILVEDREFPHVKKSLENREIITSVINKARDLVNEPGDKFYPEIFAEKAREIARNCLLDCTILDEEELKQKGYNGLVSVGKGSIYPPRMIILKYTPRKKSSVNLCLVGKGLTFDTGGISIKPSAGMWDMKGDMAGGAAVLETMEALAQLKPAINVTGIICTAENMVGQNAIRPGDIFIAKNGKSIHVDNTDAEGRLVLTDGLHRAGEEGATHIIDIATLTGSCIHAIGTSLTGVMGTSPSLIRAMTRIGNEVGDYVWELPLWEEYMEDMKVPFADINNISSSKFAGATVGGLFLKEFVPKDTPWIHLDIAGTSMADKPYRYFKAGATGVGVRWFTRLAMQFTDRVK